MTRICISKLTIMGSDNGLSPSRHQAIIWTNAGILLIGPLGTNFSEILIKVYTFSFTKMHLKMTSGKWRPFGLDLNVLTLQCDSLYWSQNSLILKWPLEASFTYIIYLRLTCGWKKWYIQCGGFLVWFTLIFVNVKYFSAVYQFQDIQAFFYFEGFSVEPKPVIDEMWCKILHLPYNMTHPFSVSTDVRRNADCLINWLNWLYMLNNSIIYKLLYYTII